MTDTTTQMVGWVSAVRLFADDGSVARTYGASLKYAGFGDWFMEMWDEDGNQVDLEQIIELFDAAPEWDTLVTVLDEKQAKAIEEQRVLDFARDEPVA